MNELTPRAMARATGALFLATIVLGIVAQMFVSARFVNLSDGAATLARITENPSLYRLGFTIYILEMMAQLGMTVGFYFLLKPVSRPLSWAAAMFGITGCVIKTTARVFYHVPLLMLDTAEPDSIAMLLKVNDQAAAVGLIFFGFYALLKGWLMIRATFLPRVLGILSLLGGIGWLTFLSPPLGLRLFPIVALVALVGSAANIGWFLVKGVDDERWREAAMASQGSIWR